jgi:hypothetical protein
MYTTTWEQVSGEGRLRPPKWEKEPYSAKKIAI